MKTDVKALKERFVHFLHAARKNAALLLFLFLFGIYGFLVFRVSQLMQTEPDDSAVAAEVESYGARVINKSVVQKLEQLEDNSVSVNALFREARSNPFQEE